jgi:hypothetical protein
MAGADGSVRVVNLEVSYKVIDLLKLKTRVLKPFFSPVFGSHNFEDLKAAKHRGRLPIKGMVA